MEKPENPKCIRCGVCCLVAECGLVDETSEDGTCLYLTIHKEGYTSCKYIKENGNTFGGGCFMRSKISLKGVYEYYKDQAEKKVGIKLVGLDLK